MSRTLRNAWSRKSPLAPGELYLQTMVMTVPNTCLIDPLAVPWNAGWEIPGAFVSPTLPAAGQRLSKFRVGQFGEPVCLVRFGRPREKIL